MQGAAIGHLPLVSLALAFSFGGCGIVRKQVAADAPDGSLHRMPAAGRARPGYYVAWLAAHGQGHFAQSPATAAWLMASGPITAIPLMLFAWCARRLPLSVMGFMQFIGPTIGIVIGVVEGEAFGPLRACSFILFWGGAAVFAYGAWRRSRAIARLGGDTRAAA